MGFKNIIKSIFKKPDKNAYKDGYEWAKQELANKRHPEQIEAHIHGSSDPFDQGAAKALIEHYREKHK